MKKKIFGIVLLTVVSLSLVAQKAVTTTGNNVSNDDFSMDYSIGQTAFNVNTNSEYTITPGVIQVFEITTPTLAVENLVEVNLFPNPTNDLVRIKSTLLYTDFKLYDLTGQLIKEGIIRDNVIDVSKVATSTYLLLITDNSGKPRKFKIIKN